MAVAHRGFARVFTQESNAVLEPAIKPDTAMIQFQLQKKIGFCGFKWFSSGSKWFQMVSSGYKWLQVVHLVSSGFKWFQAVTSGSITKDV